MEVAKGFGLLMLTILAACVDAVGTANPACVVNCKSISVAHADTIQEPGVE